jgi:cation transport ATPase
VKRNFVVSLVYNLGAGIAAMTGAVSPLFAAVLMPASAFLVFWSAVSGTRRLREL